ncbi:MAG: sugar phosphate nucleotidyltransferase [Patescibacteria group bacterium]
MKVVILCGGVGTRMKEETEFKPKPLVLVGSKPILWHIMKLYAHHGYNEFVLALGYKGHMIKEYFLNWRGLINDFTLHTKSNEIFFHNDECDNFKITFAETGQDTLTGERVRRLAKYIDGDDFMVTYGDGVGNINIKELVDFHRAQNALATVTGVRPASRFGFLNIDHDAKKVKDFFQHKVTQGMKDDLSRDFINGGFMVFNRDVLNLIPPGGMIEAVFPLLAEKGQLSVYCHPGKWKCMDTHKEAEEMNEHWTNDPFWKIWTD